ncbi:MAG TPA: site-specific DNA-methyltransferase [Acidimicrobiales bacterium]|jgi:site-specific DNA-methyltransferase (adenine-specific)|nr:site-specific DNA-methyltransferase [Acidimicrobiales bacterium]
MARRSTATSSFGVSRRENHDASGFYDRFAAPAVSADDHLGDHRALDKLIAGDSRHMEEVPDSSVALVVTSPPYFAGKEYEAALGEGAVPGSYLDYLQMLREVFADCVRALEPGGRIAVNVANLGRRPYRSLSSDVVSILQDDLLLLLRGEIVWMKQRGSSGSCAWGSFQRAANPVLRDLTERVIVASKGRFDRAVPVRARAARGLPSVSTMTRDDFMEDTLDVWEIPAESATRVGHPAPFPIELPARLIDLYTYADDLVLDPFVGSGTTAVAAVRAGRHYAGYDLDPAYIERAEARIAEERKSLRPARSDDGGPASRDLARALIEAAGFSEVVAGARFPGGVEVSFSARRDGITWLFDVAGGHTSYRSGLQRNDVLWKAIGRAAVLHQITDAPLVILAAGVPPAKSPAADSLRRVTGPGRPVLGVVDISRPGAVDELGALAG